MFFLQMSGFPGAGKSTLAQAIARMEHAVIIDHDVTKSALMKRLQHTQDVNLGALAYDVDFDLVNYYLSLGLNVILDSPCLYEDIVKRGTALAKQYGAAYKFIDCQLNNFTLTNERLQTRQAMPSQIVAVAYEANYVNALQHTQYPKTAYIVIDTSQPLEQIVDIAVEYVRETKASQVLP